MPPKEEGPGLFSKVVKFVKNSTTSWGDLEPSGDSDRDGGYSKQMLKEMIERKRRNDFVRKREFDMLRKLRRSEVMAGTDLAARPSFFQSSMPSRPDDRATTLKKIDEIEAQMSMQWWKTKHGDPSSRSSSSFALSSHIPPDDAGQPVTPPASQRTGSYTQTAPVPLRPAADNPGHERTAPVPIGQDAEDSMSLDFTDMTGKPGSGLEVTEASGLAERTAASPLDMGGAPTAAAPLAPAGATPPPAAPAPAAPAGARPGEGAPSGFTSSLFSVDVEEFAHDPELEEASIRFANGDDAGAEAGLLDVLGPQGTRADHDETWLTLFDLYRATGQQDRYETAAIDFAGRFGRSAPQWFSMPEAVGRMHAPSPAAAAPGQQLADWNCPATFGTQTLAALNAALAKVPQPWRLNWAKLTTIAEPAIEPLTKLFTQWALQPVQLRFLGAESFETVLANATPSGDRSVNPALWKLRMEVLRVMHRPDEFELVALDYCVTYEVSPPSWESARCEYKALQADGSAAAGQTLIGEAFRDSLSSGLTTGYGDSTMVGGPSSQMSNVATVELAGQVVGDGTEAMALLDGKLAGADLMIISCARLIRIDFSAAGSLLNWVTARQGEGRQIQFIDVHRLVAAFFNVIGISEHARIIVRRD